MKKQHALFIIVILVLFFSSCSKDENSSSSSPGPASIIYIDQTLKDYSSFKEGSYWIYQDSTTGVLDSVYVYDYSNGIDTVYSNNKLDGYYEYFVYECRKSYDGYIEKYSANAAWSKPDGHGPIWKDKFKPGDYVGATFLMLYPYEQGQNYYPYTQDGIVTFVNLFDSLNISGSYFKKIMKFHDTENITDYKSATNYYISKNIGIVRKEIIDSSQVWNLIRYNVVQ